MVINKIFGWNNLKGGEKMKSNFQGFIPVSLPDSKIPQCFYLREYNPKDDGSDCKTNGKLAHFSGEFCRLDKILASCRVGEKTNLKKGVISESHLKILQEQRNKTLQIFFLIQVNLSNE